jgi:hypothetical protein
MLGWWVLQQPTESAGGKPCAFCAPENPKTRGRGCSFYRLLLPRWFPTGAEVRVGQSQSLERQSGGLRVGSERQAEMGSGGGKLPSLCGRKRRVGQLRTLMSVDDLVARVFRLLERDGERNTIAMYLSDNGLGWGSTGWEGRMLPMTTRQGFRCTCVGRDVWRRDQSTGG